MAADRRSRSIGTALVLLLSWLAIQLLAAAGPASAAAPPEYVSSFGPDGTAASEFERAGPIAIDQTAGLVYVIDRDLGSVYRFDLEGNPVPFTGSASYISDNAITGLSFVPEPGRNQIAVDSASHRVYVTSENTVRAFEESGEPAEFSALGVGTSEIGGFNQLSGIAVDVEGNIYAADLGEPFIFGTGEIRIFAPTGEPVTEFDVNTNEGPANLAVDTNGNLYVNLWAARVVRFVPSEFPVTDDTEYPPNPTTVDPNNALSVAVDPGTNDLYVAEAGPPARVARYGETGALLATFAGAGEEGEVVFPEGVAVVGGSSRVFVSDAEGSHQVGIFQPIVAQPTIESTFASDITAGSATLGARINPNTVETSYRFEYGLTPCTPGPCTSVPAGGASIGDGHEPRLVTADIQGLTPGTTYHYRVVAENALGISVGDERTFTTQGSFLGFQLSDSRVWELVSPADKLGGQLVNPPSGPMQASEDGNGLAYQSINSIEPDPEGNRAIERSLILARRGADGWSSRDITPPHSKATQVGPGTEYNIFSSDLSTALLEPLDNTLLSPMASAKTPYLRENIEPPGFTPLVTAKEGFSNVPAGTVFGQPDSEVNVAGANRDLTHVVLQTEGSIAGSEPFSLFEWTGGQQLEAVSVTPIDEFGEGGDVVTGILGSDDGSVRHAVSEDGSRVFWSQGTYILGGANLSALYLRDLEVDETLRLDVAQSGPGLGEPEPRFQGASADGTVVFFTDSHQLTEDASPEGQDLYRCQLSVAHGPLDCDLSNLTASRVNPGESAKVLGIVPAISDDGSRLYYVAEGVLDAEPNEYGDVASSGEPNLYLWEKGVGSRFIATLSAADHTDWGVKGSVGVARFISAASSPNGRYFAFMSEQSLTGYENRDVASGVPVQEVFRYDAAADELVCASCNPSGASPEGERFRVPGFPKVDPQELWQDRWLAATLPEARRSPVRSLYRPRAVLDNGRLFFNAVDSLVAADANRNWDVYQYEPLGVGSCNGSESPTVARSGSACVSLLSSGSAKEEAAFLDASVSGDDVFFLTPGRLSVRDKDDIYDVYDARVNGREDVLNPVSECAGEDCRPAAVAPSDPTPASETFRGVAKRINCPKGKRKVKRHGKVRCIKRNKHRAQKHRKRDKQVRRAGR